MKKLLYLCIAFQCLFFSCKLEKEDTEELAGNEQNTAEDFNGEINLKGGELRIKNIEIEDKSEEGNGQQIIVTFDAKASAKLLKSIGDNNTLVAYVTCNGTEARTFVAGQVFEKNTVIPYRFDDVPVLYNKKEKGFKFFVPFRNLELPKGMHTLKFKLEFFAANFKIDPKQKNEGYFISMDKRPVATWETEQQFKTPDLRKITLTVDHISLNTAKKDPKTWDVRFAGPGYPDLYWEVKCGGESIYKSPVSHNVVKVDVPYTTPAFLCSPQDEIEIGVYDQDNTSKPDEVEIITKKMSDISGKLKQGNLENISIKLEKQ